MMRMTSIKGLQLLLLHRGAKHQEVSIIMHMLEQLISRKKTWLVKFSLGIIKK